jgi:hypothetical protein
VQHDETEETSFAKFRRLHRGQGSSPPSRRGVSCVILFLRRAFLPCKSSVMVVSPYACWAAREQLGLAFVRLPAVLSGWP